MPSPDVVIIGSGMGGATLAAGLAPSGARIVILERGRPMEIDALLGAVAELGRAAGVTTPTIDMVQALVVARARAAGCYGG